IRGGFAMRPTFIFLSRGSRIGYRSGETTPGMCASYVVVGAPGGAPAPTVDGREFASRLLTMFCHCSPIWGVTDWIGVARSPASFTSWRERSAEADPNFFLS